APGRVVELGPARVARGRRRPGRDGGADPPRGPASGPADDDRGPDWRPGRDDGPRVRGRATPRGRLAEPGPRAAFRLAPRGRVGGRPRVRTRPVGAPGARPLDRHPGRE